MHMSREAAGSKCGTVPHYPICLCLPDVSSMQTSIGFSVLEFRKTLSRYKTKAMKIVVTEGKGKVG